MPPNLTDPEVWVSLLALAGLEIVLGIDNLVFLAIMAQRVEETRRQLAYRMGLAAAMLSRLGLLFTLSWIIGLKSDLFTVLSQGISGRDIIMLLGGLFLIFKSSTEIFQKVEHREERELRPTKSGGSAFALVIVQIMVLDIVFSLDSVITAVGIAKYVAVMATAIVVAVAVMMLFAKPVGDFVIKHPSIQILALSFLLLIGVLLVADGFDQHVSKGYVYFAMGFALMVEVFNMRQRTKARKRDGSDGELGSGAAAASD